MESANRQSDQFEVSLFGTGYGESILVCFGGEQWAIIDSCIDRYNKRPSALNYLADRGVSFANVVLVVITHWHDDHIKGVNQILKECPNAKFIMGLALRNSMLWSIARMYDDVSSVFDSGISEYKELVKLIKESEYRGNKLKYEFAIQDRVVFRSVVGSPESNYSVCVTALSPSDIAFQRALTDFADLLENTKKVPKRPLPSGNPNLYSVVLQMEIGKTRILLGADMMHSAEHSVGWNAIIQSTCRPNVKSNIYKIAHHGSQNSDKDEIWEQMLEPNPIATLSPFVKQSTPIPSNSDLQRISSRSCELHVTCDLSQFKRKKNRDNGIEKLIRSATKMRRELPPRAGQVRISTDDINSGLYQVVSYNGGYKYKKA